MSTEDENGKIDAGNLNPQVQAAQLLNAAQGGGVWQNILNALHMNNQQGQQAPQQGAAVPPNAGQAINNARNNRPDNGPGL